MLEVVASNEVIETDPSGWSPAELTPLEADLIARMRAETNGYKESFTQQAFQALSISSIALGGILYLMFFRQIDPPVYIGLAAAPILAFSLAVCRLGGYAYSSANRHFGYELFLYRVRTIPARLSGRWRDDYRTIEWEAAMRAWRIVQATLYERIYCPGRYYILPDTYRAGFNPQKKPIWFSQSSLFASRNSDRNEAKWHAGSYLGRMQWMLFIAAGAAEIILAITPIGMSVVKSHHHKVLEISAAIAIFGAAVVYLRIGAERARRKILEDGLLSIHSCAIVWQAVVVAHFNALERSRTTGLSSWTLAKLSKDARRKYSREWKLWRDGRLDFEEIVKLAGADLSKDREIDGAGLTGYTFWLGEEAVSLARYAHDVPAWIGLGPQKLRATGDFGKNG
jgi:hypothetical protein